MEGAQAVREAQRHGRVREVFVTEAAGARQLPRSLPEALANLESCAEAREWFGEVFFDAYLRFKRAELRVLDGLTEAEICDRYADVY